MTTVTKWWTLLAFTAAVSVAAAGRLSAAEMPEEKKPLQVFLHQGQHSPQYVDEDLIKTIGVLEGRIGSHRLPRQAIAKLSAMNAEERRLVTLLCGRIAESGDKPSADLALLLVAALIVLT
jgi:hypothetical protein